MKIIIPFLLLGLTLLSCQRREQPNVLWIISDDLGVELGCYGNTDVKTPFIDKLATEGIRYERAFATAPICSPSRSSLITGMYPPSVNSQDHRTIARTHPADGIRPVTDYFREAGYFCTNGNAKEMSKPGKEDYNFLTGNLYDATDWSQRRPGQPFFAQVQIFQPHRPFTDDPENPVCPDSTHLPACYPDVPLLRADWAKYLESVQSADKQVGAILERLDAEGLADNTIVFFFGDNGRPHLRDKQFLYEGGLKVPLMIRWPGKLPKGKVYDQLVSLVDVTATSLAAAGIPLPRYMQGRDLFGENTNPRQHIFGFRQRSGEADDDIRSVTDGKFKLIWNRMPEIPWMQMSGYKKSAYPAYTLYFQMYHEGKLEQPYAQFMASQKPEVELYDLENDPDEFQNLADDIAFEKIKQQLFTTLKDSLAVFEKNMIVEKPEIFEKAKESAAVNFQKGMDKWGLNTASSDEEFIKKWESILLNNSKCKNTD